MQTLINFFMQNSFQDKPCESYFLSIFSGMVLWGHVEMKYHLADTGVTWKPMTTVLWHQMLLNGCISISREIPTLGLMYQGKIDKTVQLI